MRETTHKIISSLLVGSCDISLLVVKKVFQEIIEQRMQNLNEGRKIHWCSFYSREGENYSWINLKFKHQHVGYKNVIQLQNLLNCYQRVISKLSCIFYIVYPHEYAYIHSAFYISPRFSEIFGYSGSFQFVYEESSSEIRKKKFLHDLLKFPEL